MSMVFSSSTQKRRPPPRRVVDPENPPAITVDSLIYDYPVVLFSISDNVFCSAAKQMLKDLGARYLTIDFDKMEEDDFAHHDEVALTSGNTGAKSGPGAGGIMGNPSASSAAISAAAAVAAMSMSGNTIPTNVSSGGIIDLGQYIDMMAFSTSTDPMNMVQMSQTNPLVPTNRLADDGTIGPLTIPTSSALDTSMVDILQDTEFSSDYGLGGLADALTTPIDPTLATHLGNAEIFLASNREYHFRSSTARRLWHELALMTGQYCLPNLFIDEKHVGGTSAMYELGLDQVEEMLRKVGAIEDEEE